MPYFWGGSREDASLPEEAAASFELDSDATSSAKETESETPKVTPIADADSSPKPAGVATGPLDASEFEKALGVVKTEPTPGDANVSAIPPFVVGDQSAAEPRTARNGDSAPTRPLAPRFEETPRALAGTRDGTPRRPNADARLDSRSPYAAPPSESANFTPWQPNMASTREPAYPGPSQDRSRPDAAPSYSPWSASTTGPAPSAQAPQAPQRHDPAYTAMNPNPPRTPNAGSGEPVYQDPSPVWSPGNPYAAPNRAPGDVSPIRTPYQQ